MALLLIVGISRNKCTKLIAKLPLTLNIVLNDYLPLFTSSYFMMLFRNLFYCLIYH